MLHSISTGSASFRMLPGLLDCSTSLVSLYYNLPECPCSVKNLDSGWGTANPETCPVAQKSRFEPAPLPWSVKNLDCGWGTTSPPDHPLASQPRPNCLRPPKNLDFCLGNSPKTPPGIEPTDFTRKALQGHMPSHCAVAVIGNLYFC